MDLPEKKERNTLNPKEENSLGIESRQKERDKMKVMHACH